METITPTPQVSPVKIEQPADPRANPPADDLFTLGVWIHRETGLPYAVAKHEADNYFRSYSAKNSAHFWQGTEDEFFSQFIPQK